MERGRRHLVRLLFIFCIASCSLLAPGFFPTEPPSAVPSNIHFSDHRKGVVERQRILLSTVGSGPVGTPAKKTPLRCSTVERNSICCDRSSQLTDVCVLRGDVRTSPSFSSICLYAGDGGTRNRPAAGRPPAHRVEKIRPYARKWESKVMKTIDELDLIVLERSNESKHRCDVVHRVPAVVFSTGDDSGDINQEFNDGLIPLYITSYRYRRRVVFLVLNYQARWRAQYQEILSRLSAYPPIDFFADNRTHCFPEVTVGLRIHGEHTINPELSTPKNLTILHFQRLLDDAYRPRIRGLERSNPAPGEPGGLGLPSAPKLVIVIGNRSRAVENEIELIELCEEMGFQVQVLRPGSTTELAKIYMALNSTDAVLGVTGCELTHLLFMHPGAVFIQLVPPETEASYGALAKEIGLVHMPYKIKEWESDKSSLMEEPNAVRLDLNNLFSCLTRAYQHVVARKMEEDNSSLRWNENWLPRI